jgi:hypothetical protein
VGSLSTFDRLVAPVRTGVDVVARVGGARLDLRGRRSLGWVGKRGRRADEPVEFEDVGFDRTRRVAMLLQEHLGILATLPNALTLVG